MAQTRVTDFVRDIPDPIETASLPDRDFEWRDEPVTFAGGLEVVLPDVTHRGNPGVVSLGGDRTMRASEFGYVVDGLDQYLEQHGDREIELPTYYSRFDDEADPYIGGVTAANDSFAAGITHWRLEEGVRAATGGGAFSSGETSVIGCGKRPFIVENDQGAFAVATVDMERPEGFDLTNHPHHDIAGMSVPEDTDKVREGIAFLADVLPETFGLELVEHDGLCGGYHRFLTERGNTLRIKGYHLGRLAGTARDPEDVLGEIAYEDPWDETFHAELDSIEYPVGTPMKCRNRPPEHRPQNDVVVGYARGWADPRRSSRVSLSGRVKARAHYVRLRIRAGRDGALTIEREVHSETIEESRPENKPELATRNGM